MQNIGRFEDIPTKTEKYKELHITLPITTPTPKRNDYTISK